MRIVLDQAGGRYETRGRSESDYILSDDVLGLSRASFYI